MRANHSDRSPKMSHVSESLRSLTKTEQRWAIRSGRSPKLNKHEQIAQVAHQKLSEWAKRWFCLRESLIRSFFPKKQAIRSEKRWVNSQPWTVPIHSSTVFVHCPKNNLNPALKSSLSWLKFYHFNTFGTLERKMSFKNP